MKKYIIYAILILVGIAVGSLIFSPSYESTELDNTNHVHEEASLKSSQVWTCSMHPQIKQPDPGDCPICGMDLIPASISSGELNANSIKMSENAMALASIETSLVGEQIDSTMVLQLSGTIKINLDKTATQPAHYDGRVEQLYVETLGESITKGQKIATVYSPALIAAQQELITTARLKNTQPQLYQAVRNKFKNWKIHDDIINQVEATGKIIREFPIYSHVSGVVTEIVVNEGAHIMDGAALLEVSDLSSVWVELDVYERQLASLTTGQHLKVSSPVYPASTFNAIITFIDPLLDTTTRTTVVRAVIDNAAGLWKPGMFITAQVTIDSPQDDAIHIPKSAVIWTGKRSLVYVKTDPTAPIFEMREVILGRSTGEQYVIKKGLQLGEEIVTRGTFTVDAAAQLQGKKSMMNVDLSSSTALSDQFQQVLKSSIESYLAMKNAFVKSDALEVSAFAKATLTALNKNTGATGSKALPPTFKDLLNQLAKIAASTDLEDQRRQFVLFNEDFIQLISRIDHLDHSLYIQECPMVSNNAGASWLSADQVIRNPYYGDAMLTCGSVIQELE